MLFSTRRDQASKKRPAYGVGLCGVLATVVLFCSAIAAETSMKLVVDATDLPRKLLESKLALNLPGDSVSLWYPKWIPGIHAPRGPVENLGGFAVHDSDKEVLPWKRDWADPYRFDVYPEDGSGSVTITMAYICNQPSVNSNGVDCYGYQSLGIINWNCVVVYPEGIAAADIMVEPSLILPPGWKHGSALHAARQRGDTTWFEPLSLEELIDRPLICGPYLRSIELAVTDQARYYLHLAVETPSLFPENDSIYAPFTRLALEAEALFGRTHFDQYHLLLVLSDELPFIGLEHRNSSLNGVPSDDLTHDDWSRSHTYYVIPHEFAHAWCGKYRRPAGMHTPDYHTDKEMDLLWVYEGLDTYLGEILEARSGFVTPDQVKQEFALSAQYLADTKGRRWRPLHDTEIANYILRGGSASWRFLRRSQDYYDEGARIWMDIDGRIREATSGEKSLDDFFTAFFTHGARDSHAVPYDRSEIVQRLTSLVDLPWDSLITARTTRTQSEFDPDIFRSCGFELGYSGQKSDIQDAYETIWHEARLYTTSLGFAVDEEGLLSRTVPGGLADAAGLYDGVQIMGVGGLKFTEKRLEDAVRRSTATGRIDLLLLKGEAIENVVIEYDGGLRFPTLVPLEGKTDWLQDILAPKVATGPADQ